MAVIRYRAPSGEWTKLDISWSNISHPETFPPEPHKHDYHDVSGIDEILKALDKFIEEEPELVKHTDFSGIEKLNPESSSLRDLLDRVNSIITTLKEGKRQ